MPSVLFPLVFTAAAATAAGSWRVGDQHAWISSRPVPFSSGSDPRNILSGSLMMQSGYLDQPYCIVSTSAAHSGEWLCAITQDADHEGGNGEHVLAIRSADEGKTWSAPVTLEPGSLLTNAYSALVQEPTSGRVFCVYNMNVHNISSLPSGKKTTRTDELGVFRMRYTDDNGRTWSDPLQLPLPLTAIDLNNSWSGKVQIFWNVDVFHTWPVPGQVHDATGFFFTKMGIYPQSPPEETFVMWSPDLLRPGLAPAEATWHLAPNSSGSSPSPAGWHGVSPPNGNPTIMEEPHLLSLGQGGFYAEARTTQGLLAAAGTSSVSVEQGWPVRASFARYWVPTSSGCDDSVTAAVAEAASRAGLGRALDAAASNASALGLPSTGLLKNPRGPTMLKRLRVGLSNGSRADAVLLLFYSNSHTSFDDSRNPYFLSAGTEVPAQGGGYEIVWSQPEVVLFDRLVPTDRPGYPDMTVRASDGAVVITQTNKSVARASPVPIGIVTALLGQRSANRAQEQDIVARWSGPAKAATLDAPGFARFAPYNASAMPGDGLTLQVWLEGHEAAKAGQVVLSNTGLGTVGVQVTVAAGGALTVSVAGPQGGSLSYTMDTQCASQLAAGGDSHYVAVVLDSAARLASWVVDGMVCDGGASSTNGWSWFGPNPQDDPVSVGGTSSLAIAPSYTGKVLSGSVYNRALLFSQVVGNFRAGEGSARAR